MVDTELVWILERVCTGNGVSVSGKFSVEFKQQAVDLVINSGKPVAEIARDLGVHVNTLGNWVNKYKSVHAGDNSELSVSEKVELEKLRKDIHILRMEREILKKAAAFFAKEHQ